MKKNDLTFGEIRRSLCTLITLVAMMLAMAGRAASPPVLLVHDNFDAATGNTTDLNVDIARQTGTLAPITYTMASGPGHYGHQLQNVNAPNQLLVADFPNSTSSLNYNFNGASSAGGLKISFDLDSVPTVYGGTPDNWGCINVGLAAGDQLANVNQGVPHLGILFRAAGTIQAFDGGPVVTPSPEPVYSTRPPGTANHIDLIITDTDGNPFDGVGNTIVEVYVNGGALPVWSFIKVGGYAHNHINVQGSFRSHIDNLAVYQLPADLTPVVANPSFEADTFSVFPGYVNGNGPITGWTALGGHGVNPGTFGGPFADNGAIPDGTKAAFMQDDGALRQVISGFTIGAAYQIRYSENARTGPTAPAVAVTIGGNTIVAAHAVTPVGGGNPYHQVTSDSFTATATSMELAFIKSNPQGGDTTALIDNVSVLLPNTPPTITVQPQSQEIGLGETVTLTVVASGSFPLSYQWYVGGVALPGQTSPTLTSAIDFPEDGGDYHVVVGNSAGSATSAIARITVRARITDLFNTGVDSTGAALADGAVDPHYQLVVNADGPSTDAIVQESTTFPIVAGPWFANNASSKWIGPRLNTAAAAGLASGGGIYVYQTTFDLTGLDRNSVVITGGWATDNEGLGIRVNGTPVAGSTSPGFGGLTPFTLTSVNATFIDGINTLEFEVRNVDVEAGYTGLRVANLRGLAPLPGTPPAITAQPQSQLAGTGEAISFTVIATGSSPLGYQWMFNGAPIAGATGAILALNNVTRNDAGSYTVVLSNPVDTLTSAAAVLTVFDTVPGVFNTGVDDAKAALADGVVDSHYRLIVNPDSSSADSIVEDSTVFPIVTGPWVANTPFSKWIGPRVETSAAAGAEGAGGDYVYRTTVDLTGFDPASVVITGVWSTDNAGVDIFINGVPTGQANTAQFVAFTPFAITNGFLAGINTLDFKVNNSAVGYTGLRVQNLRGLGNALPPNTPPSIVTQPQSQVANIGDKVTFNVRVSGSTPLEYQWFFGPDALPGETNPTLAVLLEFPDQLGAYSVQISNAAGSATSAPAVLSLPNECPVANPLAVSVEEGSSVSFQLPASDADGNPLQYSITQAPAHGTVALQIQTGAASYTPTAGYCGPDSFSFKVNDGLCDSAVATVTVDVKCNQCPMVSPLSLAVDQDSSVSFNLPASDADGHALQYSITQAPAHGTVVLQVLTGAASYTPTAGYCGPDSFSFKVNDGLCDSAVATVTIGVRCLNQSPVAVAKVEPLANLSAHLTERLIISANGSNATVMLDGSMSTDPDNDPLSYLWYRDGLPDLFAAGVRATNTLEVGTHQIVLLVADGKGGTATDSIQVEVITLSEAVAILIEELDNADLGRQNKRPLIASLKASFGAFERGQMNAGANTLKAFQNKVRAQVARNNPAAATELIRIAQEIVDALNRP